MNRQKIYIVFSVVLVALIILVVWRLKSGNNENTRLDAPFSEASDMTSQDTTVLENKKDKVLLQASFAASLSDVAKELSAQFEKENPNIQIQYNFGSSGKLQQQMEQQAPVDVFLSAGKKQIDELIQKGLVDKQDSMDLLENTLVLIVPKGSSLKLTDFSEVTDSAVKAIAVGDEGVPVGQYTQQIYEHLGIWEDVLKKASLGSDVRTVLAWVEQGSVDCGVVYATDAAISKQVDIVAKAPEGSHKPVIYPLAMIKNTAHPKEAKQWMDFLQSEAAASIFEKFGFQRVK